MARSVFAQRLAACSLGVLSLASLGGACSRVNEPNPVDKEMKPQPDPNKPAATIAQGAPSVSAQTVDCPIDPEPQQNASLYGHGKATFVTPDGAKHEFDVEIAASEAAQERGLMYRTSLGPTAGMVFAFAEAHHATFWMKNTCIALDMVFVGESGKVIGVVTAPPLTTDQRQVPGYSKWVVELAAGVAQQNGIAIGTTFIPPAS